MLDITFRPSTNQDDPVTIPLASDKHNDKRNKHGRFVDPLEITYRDVVACVRDIYSRDRLSSKHVSVSDGLFRWSNNCV